jgi:hypothetical protein
MASADDCFSAAYRLRKCSDMFASKLKAEVTAICAGLEDGETVDVGPLLADTAIVGEEFAAALSRAVELLDEAERT